MIIEHRYTVVMVSSVYRGSKSDDTVTDDITIDKTKQRGSRGRRHNSASMSGS